MKPVKELHAGNVLLPPLRVQLVPKYLGHPLGHSTKM